MPDYIRVTSGGERSMSVSFTLTGLDDLRAALQAWGQRALEAAGAALYQEAENLMTDAKERTPMDTGSLKASGHVWPPSYTGTEVRVVLGFGGPSGPGYRDSYGYAVFVHEDLHAFHDVGEAKFLERPVTAWMADAERALAARMQRNLAA